MKTAWLVWIVILGVPTVGQVTSGTERPVEVKELIAKLPECSKFREQLEQGRFGDNIEKPYMRAMREHGVQRAFFDIHGKWRNGHAEGLRIVRRLYFLELDGPEALIADGAALTEIASSGLETLLDAVVLELSKNTHLFSRADLWPAAMIDNWGWHLKGSRISGSVELFATPWLPAVDVVGRGSSRHEIEYAAKVGDVVSLSKFLAAKRYSQSEMNRALFSAAFSLRNNTAAIQLLIKAGADVNARSEDGEETTPLMNALYCPCNIPPLLTLGARVEDHDKWGHTAYDLARQRHYAVAMQLLESAKAQK